MLSCGAAEDRKDLLVLHGGTDIDPSIYKHPRLPETQMANKARDVQEMYLVKQAIKDKKPILGICRGAQLLCALNGGSLWQHATGHHRAHSITIYDGSEIDYATSCHHQIMNLDGTKHELLAWDSRPTKVLTLKREVIILEKSPEVAYFPETNSLAVQPHPEWMHHKDEFIIWLNKILFEKFNLQGVF